MIPAIIPGLKFFLSLHMYSFDLFVFAYKLLMYVSNPDSLLAFPSPVTPIFPITLLTPPIHPSITPPSTFLHRLL